MMTHNERNNALIDLYRSSIQAEQLLQQKENILNKINELREKLNGLAEAKGKYEKVLILCNNGINSYKEERLKCLEEQVKENLSTIFPEDNFNVAFMPTIYRGKEVIDFLAGRGDNLYPTRMQNGRLFRQLCSFSISTMIQILAGCEILIMDEAINSGDIESTSVVSNLIRNLVDNDYQIILIEHKDALYKELPRVQYNLYRDKKLNKITEVIRNEY